MVYELSAGGDERVVYSFNRASAGGYTPSSGVIRDSSGSLYGTTGGGGYNEGAVAYKLGTSGNETVLHTFYGSFGGGGPLGGLMRHSSGNLYGACSGGGNGFGVVFVLTGGSAPE